MKKSLPILFLILLAASCSSSNEEPVFDSGKAYDESLPTIFQNGDILYSSSASHYLDVAHQVSGNELVNSLKAGEDSLVLFAAGDCSHCLRLEPNFVKAIKESRYDIKLIYTDSLSDLTNIRAVRNRVQIDYPTYFSESVAFPISYILTSRESTRFAYNGHMDSPYKVLSYLQEKVNRAEVYRFHSLESFNRFVAEKKAPGIIYGNASTSAIPSSLYQVAIRSKSKIAILDASSLSEEEKASACEDGVKYVIEGEGEVSFATGEEANAFLTAYYEEERPLSAIAKI